MGEGFAFLGFGLALAIASRPIARLILRMRGLEGLEATEPVVFQWSQGIYRWIFVLIGVSAAVYGAIVISFGSRL